MRALIVGASRGIGLALVRGLLADPAVEHVTAAARAPTASSELEALAAGHRDRLSLLQVDVGDEAKMAPAAECVRRSGDRLHLLINSAGLLHADGVAPERRLADVRPESFLRAMTVNALGPLLLAKHFGALLTHGDRAVLANLSARVGSIGDNRLGGWYAYRASKAAQNQVTRTLSIEFARRAPRLICVALHPGTVETDLSAPFRGNTAAAKLFTPEKAAAQLLAVIGNLTPESSGRFYAWDGVEIPW